MSRKAGSPPCPTSCYKLQSDTALYPLDSVTGGTPPSQLDAQGALEMSQAEAAAKTAALRHLGYTVTAIPSGAVIFGTYPGTPAYPVLNVGDVITAVDGVATPDADDLTKALSRHHPGQTVTLTVRKGGTGHPAAVPVTLKRTVVNLGNGQTITVDLGIDTEDQVDYTYPFPVNIDVTNIGGPSAGLAMTLGVIDALDNGSLTGGLTVAATGHDRRPGRRRRRRRRPPEDGCRRECGRLDLFRATPGVQGRHEQGPSRPQDLLRLHARPGPGHPGRPWGLGAEDPADPLRGHGMTGLADRRS